MLFKYLQSPSDILVATCVLLSQCFIHCDRGHKNTQRVFNHHSLMDRQPEYSLVIVTSVGHSYTCVFFSALRLVSAMKHPIIRLHACTQPPMAIWDNTHISGNRWSAGACTSHLPKDQLGTVNQNPFPTMNTLQKWTVLKLSNTFMRI